MSFEVADSVYFLLIKDDSLLRTTLFDFIEQNHETVYVCNSVEDYVYKTSYFTGNTSSFIVSFIECTPDIMHYVQDSVIMKTGIPGFFPLGTFLFLDSSDKKFSYVMPTHVKHIQAHYKTLEIVDTKDIDLEDSPRRLAFLDEIRSKNSKMRFHLYNQICHYYLLDKVETNFQAVAILREDVMELINPDQHSFEKIAKKNTVISFSKITEDLREDIKNNKYLMGGIDWIIAHAWINRAKYMVSLLLFVATLGFYFSTDIYRVYYTVDFIFKNKYQLERVVEKERIKAKKEIQAEVKGK